MEEVSRECLLIAFLVEKYPEVSAVQGRLSCLLRLATRPWVSIPCNQYFRDGSTISIIAQILPPPLRVRSPINMYNIFLRPANLRGRRRRSGGQICASRGVTQFLAQYDNMIQRVLPTMEMKIMYNLYRNPSTSGQKPQLRV